MSHEIMENDKQQGREMAWHGLTDVQPELTLENCWLKSWDYVPRKVTVEGENGKAIETGFLALGVSDVEGLFIGTPYSADSFRPVLNATLIDLLEKGTKGKDLVLSSCGTVKNRGRQFLSFEMGESYRAAGREFRPFFNVGNGNDMSSPVWQNTSTTCTVCNNTFQMNMLESGLIMAVKKTKFSDLKLGDFSAAMKAMLTGQKEFAGMMESLAKIKISPDTARQFFTGFVGTPDKPLSTRSEGTIDRLVELFAKGAGNSGENASDVFQAITDYYTHEAANSQGDDDANWKNYVSSEFGSGRIAKQRAWMILNTEKLRKGTELMGRKIAKLTAEAARQAEVEA